MEVSFEDLRRGCEAFEQREGRDVMYKVASELVARHWGDPEPMADALGVLLLTWNYAFYRYGPFEFAALEDCLRRQGDVLEGFRPRGIATCAKRDQPAIRAVFGDFLEALARSGKGGKTHRSPVAVGKALHLLAPEFFPLWDGGIARAYKCVWATASGASAVYVRFMEEVRGALESLSLKTPLAEVKAALDGQSRFPKPLLKLLDQYNYARYTKRWI